ncbi:MAG: hypothetical protein DRO87_13105, partial [Candidatus Thorarchaeota archaeon]
MSTLALLKEIQNRGIHLELLGDNKLRYRSSRPILPDLLEKLKAEKPRIIELLRSNKGSQQDKSQTDPKTSPDFTRRWCQGCQPFRYVHFEVCKWHLKSADSKCANCKHLSREDRELWMNAYLDKAIARLNAYYEPGNKIDWDRQVARQRIDQVEEKITQAF